MLHPLIDPPKSRDTRNTLLFKIVRKEMIQLLGLDPRVTDDELILQRNQRYQANPKEYVDMLFKDVGLESLLVDYGFPVMGSRLAQDELDWFHQTSSSIPTRRIHRVEATYPPAVRGEGTLRGIGRDLPPGAAGRGGESGDYCF